MNGWYIVLYEKNLGCFRWKKGNNSKLGKVKLWASHIVLAFNELDKCTSMMFQYFHFQLSEYWNTDTMWNHMFYKEIYSENLKSLFIHIFIEMQYFHLSICAGIMWQKRGKFWQNLSGCQLKAGRMWSSVFYLFFNFISYICYYFSFLPYQLVGTERNVYTSKFIYLISSYI